MKFLNKLSYYLNKIKISEHKKINNLINEIHDFNKQRYQVYFDSVEYIFESTVDGDVVEFGVMRGYSSVAFASSLNLFNKKNLFNNKKKIYLFDSFKGLPIIEHEIDQKNINVKNNFWHEGAVKGYTRNEIENIMQNYIDKDSIEIYEGYFDQTIKQLEDKSLFSLIHVDSDLYLSCIQALEPLFENKFVSTGAIILFDNFNLSKSDKELGERKAWSDIVKKYKIDFFDQGAYGSAGNKFIVHSYI